MLRVINYLFYFFVLLFPFAVLIYFSRWLHFLSGAWLWSTGAAVVLLLALAIKSRSRGAAVRDYSAELAAIFESFAHRHNLAVVIDESQATTFTFEAGGALKRWLILSIVGDDEVLLDFGAYYFRYFYQTAQRETLERFLDQWIAGKSRIVAYSGGGHVLETATQSGWTEFTRMNVGPIRGRPIDVVTNAV